MVQMCRAECGGLTLPSVVASASESNAPKPRAAAFRWKLLEVRALSNRRTPYPQMPEWFPISTLFHTKTFFSTLSRDESGLLLIHVNRRPDYKQT